VPTIITASIAAIILFSFTLNPPREKFYIITVLFGTERLRIVQKQNLKINKTACGFTHAIAVNL
jgi:hypothetical protein